MLLQKQIDAVLEGVKLADLMHDEVIVRSRVGFRPADQATERRLPVLVQG
jgi:hypothetical protein